VILTAYQLRIFYNVSSTSLELFLIGSETKVGVPVL
jgi:hypothetical protein